MELDYYVLTLFPDMIRDGLRTSIIGRAIEEDILHLKAVNIRDYTNSRHGKTDDYPYGGGAGMVMQAQPVYDAYRSVADRLDYNPRVVYLTPQGRSSTRRWPGSWRCAGALSFCAATMRG